MAVSLHISNAFDKVWDKSLLYIFESVGISGNLLSLMESFCVKDIKEFFIMDNHPRGLVLKLVFLRDQFWASSFSYLH